MRILFLAKSPDATAYYRCEIPQKYLILQGHEVRRCYVDKTTAGPMVEASDVERAEVIVFQRPLTADALRLAVEIKREHPSKVMVGDYDDDYFSVPTWNPGYTVVKAYEPTWSKMFDLYDGVIASTVSLADVLHEKTKAPVKIIPNGFDFDMFDNLQDPRPFAINASKQGSDGKVEHVYQVSSEQFNQLMEDRTVVAWAGSRFHYVDLDWLAPCIGEVCKKSDDIVFLFIGYVQGNVLKDAPISRLFTCGGAYPTPEYYRLLKSLKIDIMLAPLDPCRFNLSKSNLKILESMALGAYPICSDLDPYEDDLDPEAMLWEQDTWMPRHGTLVPYGSKSWSRAILETTRMLSDPVKRQTILKNNEDYVRNQHCAKTRTDSYVKFFEGLLKGKLS